MHEQPGADEIYAEDLTGSATMRRSYKDLKAYDACRCFHSLVACLISLSHGLFMLSFVLFEEINLFSISMDFFLN